MLATLFWILLFLVALPALAVAGALLVRQRVGPEVLARHNDVAGFIYAVIGVVYAVLLGFTAIIVWEQFRHAGGVAEQEANELADLFRDAQVFPPEPRRRIETGVRAYVRIVLEQEWPAMAEGRSSPEAWDAYNQLWRIYYEIKPEDDHQRAWYAESIHRLNLLGDHRRNRMLTVRAGVPAVMWAALIGGGIVTIAFSFLFGTRSARAQAAMTVGLSLVIGLMLLAILALEDPFAGITRVHPEAFRQVGEIFGSLGRTP
ncbi:MAG: DUF4239 domain-containing protein [Gemmatimonadales bacterium]